MEARYIWRQNPSVWWSRCARHRTSWRSLCDLHKFRADRSSWFSRSSKMSTKFRANKKTVIGVRLADLVGYSNCAEPQWCRQHHILPTQFASHSITQQINTVYTLIDFNSRKHTAWCELTSARLSNLLSMSTCLLPCLYPRDVIIIYFK